MRAGTIRHVAALVTVAAGLAAGPARADGPARIVSLNLCTDQILLDLVAPKRIAALSFLASDPTMSAVAEQARRHASVRGAAEEVLALDPDLVIAGQYSTKPTVDLLTRLGRRVVVVPQASSLAEIRSSVRALAAAVGEPDRGEDMISTFDRRIAAARPVSGPNPTALAMQVNSLVAARGSLIDHALEAAGFDNPARRLALGPAGRLPLESLLARPPDLLILANAPDDFRTVLADNLRHPAFARLAGARPSIHLPMSEWLCGTPRIASVVERLAAVRIELLAHSHRSAREANAGARSHAPPGWREP